MERFTRMGTGFRQYKGGRFCVTCKEEAAERRFEKERKLYNCALYVSL